MDWTRNCQPFFLPFQGFGDTTVPACMSTTHTHAETRQRRRPKPVWAEAVMFSILAPCPAALRRGAVIAEAFPPARNIIYTHTHTQTHRRELHAALHGSTSHHRMLTYCSLDRYNAISSPQSFASASAAKSLPASTPPRPLRMWLSRDTEKSTWRCQSLICYSTACNPDDRVKWVYGERRRI